MPSEWIAGLFGSNQGLGALMAADLGVPLYTCGGGTLFQTHNEARSIAGGYKIEVKKSHKF